MKTKFIMLLLAVLTATGLSAQAPEKKQRPDRAKLQEMQCNQVVKALMLDDATAAKFTPVYQNYLNELKGNRGVRMHKPRVKEAPGTVKPMPTDAEVEKAIKDRFAQSRKMLDTREKYYTEFRKILSPKQIARIYQLEKGNAHKFKKEWQKRQGKRSDNKRGEKSPSQERGK